MTSWMNLKSLPSELKNISIQNQDILFLSIITLMSAIYYIGGLGFYSDDWSFLAYFNLSTDQSITGLFQSVYSPQVQMRPVQVLYLAGLYWAFGLNPLGYHIVNLFVFLIGIILFYLVIRKFLIFDRVLSLSIPLVFSLLPHYSTNRFWYVAFQANLSMTLYFLSLYADLKRSESRHWQGYLWLGASLFSLVCSGLAYEVFLPVFLINPVLVWYRNRHLEFFRLHPKKLWINFSSHIALTLLTLFLVFAYKLVTTSRIGEKGELSHQILSILKTAFAWNYDPYGYGLNIKQAILVNYGSYGIGLIQSAFKMLVYYSNIWICLLTAIASFGIFSYLRKVVFQEYRNETSLAEIRNLLGLGLVFFVLGYSIFLTNYNVVFTPMGIGNRTAIAAAIGVTFSLIGIVTAATFSLPRVYLRKRLFCLLVTLICGSGFLINNTIASFWIEAYQKEKTVLTHIQQDFKTLPSGSIVLLDGICPYVGPAVVFESSWDLAGALIILYRDYDLKADVISSQAKLKDDGIEIRIYNSLVELYPYGTLFVYHGGDRSIHELVNKEAAQQYFQRQDTNYYAGSCPEGQPGFGVSIL